MTSPSDFALLHVMAARKEETNDMNELLHRIVFLTLWPLNKLVMVMER